MAAAEKVLGVLLAALGIAMAVVGTWFWIWWLPNTLASWIGGSPWLWVLVVVLVGIPAVELILGLLILIISLPAMGLQASLDQWRARKKG